MSRAVEPVIKTRGARAHTDAGDSPQTQLVKYFPIETAGTYLAAAGIIAASTDLTSSLRVWLLIASFVVLLALTAVGLVRLYPSSKYAQPAVPVLIGIGAFLVWVYSLNDLSGALGIYNGAVAALLALLYASIATTVCPGVQQLESADGQ